MWNYIYFSIYLDQIDTSDHNAIEGYVYDTVRTLIFSLWERVYLLHSSSSQIQEEDLEFFPLLAALSLGEEEDEIACQLEQLQTMVKDVLDHQKAEVRVCVSSEQGQAKGPRRTLKMSTLLHKMHATLFPGEWDDTEIQASRTSHVGTAESGYRIWSSS